MAEMPIMQALRTLQACEMTLGIELTLKSLKQQFDDDPKLLEMGVTIEAYLDDGVGESVSFWGRYGVDEDDQMLDVDYWTAETVREALGMGVMLDEMSFTRPHVEAQIAYMAEHPRLPYAADMISPILPKT